MAPMYLSLMSQEYTKCVLMVTVELAVTTVDGNDMFLFGNVPPKMFQDIIVPAANALIVTVKTINKLKLERFVAMGFDL